MTNAFTEDKVRLDKWLWAARFFKTRRLAKAAIDGGKVRCAGQRVKAGKEIAVGDSLTIRQGIAEKDVRVTALSDQRRGAVEVLRDSGRVRPLGRAAQNRVLDHPVFVFTAALEVDLAPQLTHRRNIEPAIVREVDGVRSREFLLQLGDLFFFLCSRQHATLSFGLGARPRGPRPAEKSRF